MVYQCRTIKAIKALTENARRRRRRIIQPDRARGSSNIYNKIWGISTEVTHFPAQAAPKGVFRTGGASGAGPFRFPERKRAIRENATPYEAKELDVK